MKTLYDFEVSKEKNPGTLLIHTYTSNGEKLYVNFEQIHVYLMCKGFTRMTIRNIFGQYESHIAGLISMFDDRDIFKTKGFLIEAMLNVDTRPHNLPKIRDILNGIEFDAEHGRMSDSHDFMKLWEYFGTKDLKVILDTWFSEEKLYRGNLFRCIREIFIPQLIEAIDTDSNIADMPAEWIAQIFSKEERARLQKYYLTRLQNYYLGE